MTKAAPPVPYNSLGLETKKFAHRREPYWQGIRQILQMGYPPEDLIHHFPAFTGHVCIGRFLALYEAYRLTQGLVGHIAEAGVWKGSSLLFLAKLTQLFEPESLTQVHGFDWFKEAELDPEEAHLGDPGPYQESQERLQKLIDVQSLDSIVKLHVVDLRSELDDFFHKYEHLQFKLVFLDCGLYRAVYHCIEHFWPRLTPGGILLLDNFNHETAPGEARAVRELLPDIKLQTFPFAQQPSAYIVKPYK